MTPEEIEELRAMVTRLGANAYDENLAAILGAALEHIDQQATALDEAEALARKNVELMNGYLARIAELESQILHQTAISACRIEERERLQKQIAALREIAIGKRTQEIYDEKFGHLTISIPACVVEYWENLKIAQDEARRQLAKEHPEAFR